MSWEPGLVFYSIFSKYWGHQHNHVKNCCKPVFYLPNASKYASLLLSHMPQHLQPLDFCTLFWCLVLSSPLISSAGMDFCLASSPPTSARQGLNSRISLWLQVPHTPLGSQAPGPGSHSPDQHSCLSLSYFKSIRGGPLVTKITYRIPPLSASTGSLLQVLFLLERFPTYLSTPFNKALKR